MTIALVPNQSAILKALRTFLLGILPSKVEVILAQVNRVPEPKGKDFVLMNPVRRERLATNVDDSEDVSFTGSIVGTLLTVSAIDFGKIKVGATVLGAGVAAGTSVKALGTGTGGIGTYAVQPSQNVVEQPMASGATDIMQPTNVVVQIDVHGPNGSDNAQIIATLLRDEYAVEQFATYGVDVMPLYADDPKQLPFLNAEQQYEDRWVVEAALQANETVSVSQQFAAALALGLINVDERYPAS